MSDNGSSAPINSSDSSSSEASNTDLNAQGNESINLEGNQSSEESSSNGEALNASNEASSEGSEPSKKEVKQAAAKVDAKQSKADPEKYTIKVDGQLLELNKEEMVKYAQLGRAGQSRMEEAARIKQEAIQLVQMLRTNPEAVLADPNILGSEDKVIELAQKILSRKLEDDQKSPEVREKERLQRELEDLRAHMKQEEERRQAAEYERLVQQQEAQLEEQITEAFEASQLPKSPFVLKRLADVMITAAENNKDISPKQALNIIKKEMQRDIQQYIDVLPEDALEAYISAEKVKKLRDRQIAKAREATKAAAPKVAEVKEVASPSSEPAKKAKISMRDWLRGK
jgi:hypothetical protein